MAALARSSLFKKGCWLPMNLFGSFAVEVHRLDGTVRLRQFSQSYPVVFAASRQIFGVRYKWYDTEL